MRPSLATSRLRLEPLTADHAELLAALDADAEVMHHIFGHGLSRQESLAFLPRRTRAEADRRRLGWWVGFQSGVGGEEFVGWWCLALDEDPTTAELGYRLPRSAWGRGLATEGARALLDHGFEAVALGSVWATARETNLPSQRVLEKCGLRRSAAVPTGEPSLLGFRVTRQEWADFLMGELRKHAGWENARGAQDEAAHLAALGADLAVPRLLDHLLHLEEVDLTDDAGDVADEVWRGRVAVRHGLELVGEPARPWLRPLLDRPLGWPAYVAARVLAPYDAAAVAAAVARWRRESVPGNGWMLEDLSA